MVIQQAGEHSRFDMERGESPSSTHVHASLQYDAPCFSSRSCHRCNRGCGRGEKGDFTYHLSQVCRPFLLLRWSPRLSTEYPRKSLQQKKGPSVTPARRGVRRVYAPALIRANKGSMTALRPLVSNDPMQAIALERARGTGVDRPAPTILLRVDEAAVDGLAGARELQGARRHIVIADERLDCLRLEPRSAPHVRLDELARALLRDCTHRWGAGAPAL